MATRKIVIDAEVEEAVAALADEDSIKFDEALNKAAKTGCSRLWALRKYSGKSGTTPKKRKPAKKAAKKKAPAKKAAKKASAKKTTVKKAPKKTAKKTSSKTSAAKAKAKAKAK
jgi:hypothetical protein